MNIFLIILTVIIGIVIYLIIYNIYLRKTNSIKIKGFHMEGSVPIIVLQYHTWVDNVMIKFHDENFTSFTDLQNAVKGKYILDCPSNIKLPCVLTFALMTEDGKILAKDSKSFGNISNNENTYLIDGEYKLIKCFNDITKAGSYGLLSVISFGEYDKSNDKIIVYLCDLNRIVNVYNTSRRSIESLSFGFKVEQSYLVFLLVKTNNEKKLISVNIDSVYDIMKELENSKNISTFESFHDAFKEINKNIIQNNSEKILVT